MKRGILKGWRATAALGAFAFAFAYSASARDSNLIVCAGGVYCYAEVLQPCLEGGGGGYCETAWRMCVLDACPQ
ncbi:hypothetical protein [Pseudomonas sp. CGJS7]|uniref:hypothetical protein n=1 Tax=Pseudomonas sp. CGJS7 TaxID=3109348 RepID=UPI00300AEC2B